MFIRNLQIIRLICNQNRYRFFSTTKIPLNPKHEETQLLNKKIQNDILPIETKLPTYLPAPTGVKSKLFDDFYLIYRFRFHGPVRYIQVLKLAQTLAT